MFVIKRFSQYFVVLCILLFPGIALGQSIQMQADSSKIYAGMPFTISMVVSDVEESPQPEIVPFEIVDAEVKLVGVQPRVSSMTTIINGRRTSRKDVSFVFSYEVTPNREGMFEIPAITVRQGTRVASSQGRATFEARAVELTRDMRIELDLPKRELWVGETFDATLLWSLRTSVSSQVFSLPLYSMPDYFEVEDPKTSATNRVIYLNAGQRTIPYPFSEESVLIDGLEYRQFRTQLRVTALKSGTIALAPSTVLADLSVGRQADPFGFGRADYAFYKAEDVARKLVVRNLPQAERPAAFVNALGSDFEISVAADRTIVKLGDPIMLTIDIASSKVDEGLILPSLNLAGLNEQLFSVSTEAPIGELIQAAQGRMIRRFSVPIRVKSERVKEIPPLTFAYFDPKREQYQSVHSAAIALNVIAVGKVSIDDVVMGQPSGLAKGQGASSDAGSGNAGTGTVLAPSANLNFGLNARDSDLNPTILTTYGRHLMLGLYVTPFVLWAFLLVIRRSRRRVARDWAQREVSKALGVALAMAKKRPARETASELSNALGAYLTTTESPREPFGAIFEELGASAYHPETQMRPLNDALLKTLRDTAKAEVNPKYAKTVGLILSMFLAFGLGFSSHSVDAQEILDGPTKLEANVDESDALQGHLEPQNQDVEASPQGRDEISRMPDVLGQSENWDDAQWREELHGAEALYREAMGMAVRSDRLAKFRASAARYARLAKAFPESAAILVDWGNACLNASDLGCASLAYKHALSLEPSHRQAKTNRDFILSTIGAAPHVESRAFSSFFFLNDSFSRDQRLLWAAAFFALAILLMIPWHAGSKYALRIVSVLPLILWLWFMSSVFLEPQSEASGVVLQELWLKTADNLGAANSSPSSLPPGMDVTIIEQRGDWCNVRASNGSQGWARQSGIGR